MKIYIYSLSDLDSIFYIGQTKNVKSRLASHISGSRLLKNDKDAMIRKILSEGRKPIASILHECNSDNSNAIEAEYILQYLQKGCPLINSVVNRAKRMRDYANSKLNKMEIQVLNYMASDLTTEDIAIEMFRSTRTIETIRGRAKSKLHCKTSAGMIIAGIKKGYIPI